MKLALSLALLCLLSAPATAIDRTRSTWQEGCQERQVQVLDKCQLSLFEKIVNESVALPLSGSALQ